MYFERSSSGFEGRGLDSLSIEARIMLADVLNQLGDFKAAAAKIFALNDEIDRSFPGNPILKSEVYKVLGNYYLLTGQVDSAYNFIQQAIDLRKDATGKFDTAHAYMFSKKAFLYYMVGEYDSAFLFYKQSLDLALKNNEITYDISTYYQGIGIAYAMKGFYNEAENSFLKSLEIGKIFLNSTDPKLARLYANIGKFYFDISKTDQAFDYLKSAEKIYNSTFERSNINLAYIYWLLGNYYFYKRDYQESIVYLQEALFIFSMNLSDHDPRFKTLYMDLGVAYEKAGDLNEAVRYYKQSIEGNNTPSVIKSYRNLANAYNTLDMYDLAEINYLKSINATLNILGNKDRDLALSYRYYGQFLIESKNDIKGLEYYERSLNILKDILRPDHEDIARTYLLYGEYYLHAQDFTQAKNFINKAIGLISGVTVNKAVDQQSTSEEAAVFLSEALDLRAKANLGLYHQTMETHFLEECLADISAVIEEFNALRMSYSNEESKIQLMGRAKSAINTGIYAAYLLYDISGDDRYAHLVFELSEKSKSIVLLNSLRGLEALKTSGLPVHITEKENQLKSDLYSYNSLIYKEKKEIDPDEEKIRLWQNISFKLKKQYDSLVLSLENNFPSFYKLKYDNTVISAKSAMTLLDSTQALLEYAKSDSSIFLSVLTDKSIECISIPDPMDSISNDIAGLIDLLRQNTMGFYTDEDFSRFCSLSHNIYSRLLGPISSRIKNKRLIIIPDGYLGYLSFDALIASMPDTRDPDYKVLDYLLYHHPISYSSSATILFGMEQQKGPNVRNKLLAFAPEYSSSNEGSTLRSSEPGIDSLRLLPIKGVEEEVGRILDIFRGTAYSGVEATEHNFKANAGDYNVLHLAMHTLIDNTNPLFSKMVFTSGGYENEDGMLNTYELFSMNLKGSLGVLSACNTGSGKLEKGEGIMSLARGFIYAGIPNLVMTLWEIEDQPSTDIMAIFYTRLKEGDPTDIALQKAKIEYLRSEDKFMTHPTYWAGFVNIGKSSPVTDNASNHRYYWVFAALAIVLLVIFINRQVYLRKKTD